MSSPEVSSDPLRLQALMKRRGELLPIVTLLREYKDVRRQWDEVTEMLGLEDEDLRKLAAEEREVLSQALDRLEEQLFDYLNPDQTAADRAVVMEVRAGTGGEEAALFARDLVRMYLKFAEKKGWKTELVHSLLSDRGGFKEAILHISGKDAWKFLRYESGVHRVQRIPVTEASGRIHTSAATVAVLPELDQSAVEIKEEDLEIETFRSSGPGGQHMQKNETAVRVRHRPTGLIVECQDQRSQHQNRLKALRILATRLAEAKAREQEESLQRLRRSHIKSGDRSDKDRTYNFPQNRVTDHRYGVTVYDLKSVLEGDLDELLTAIRKEEISQMMGDWRKGKGITPSSVRQ
ncbi:MAG: peptide chain release factor 1 [Armatimonadota bacterium]|nr:peptide chain release factor 1 [Armatimonadota bacterium]